MTGLELEKAITDFLSTMDEVPNATNAAQAYQQELEDKTQDILHIAEMRPYALTNINLVETLHDIRVERRTAKQEQEVMEICNKWYKYSKQVRAELANSLGQIRKILRKQAIASYRTKTNVIEPENTCVMYDMKEISGQICFFDNK